MAHHLKQVVSDLQLVCQKIKQLNDYKVFKLVCALQWFGLPSVVYCVSVTRSFNS